MSLFAGAFGNTNNTGTTGGGLFGAQNTNQTTGGTPAFGQTATTNPLQAQPTQPSLFGNTNTNTNTGPGLFGSTNTNQTQSTTAPAGGGLFGGAFGGNNTATNTNQPAAGTTNLFGNTNASNTTGANSLFGNTANNTGTGTFGNFAGTQQQGNSLFGNNAANSTTGGTSTFGNTANNTGTGIFGNPAATQQQGNSLFGNNAANTTNANAAGGTSLFGNTTNNTGTGIFGNPTGNQQQGNSFFNNNAANSTTNNATTGTTGLFGNTGTNTTAGNGLFSLNTQPTTNTTGTTGLFGGAKPATGGGLFGSTTTGTGTPSNITQPSLFGGGSSLFGQQQQQQQPQQQQSSAFGASLFGNKSTLGTSALGAQTQSNTGATTGNQQQAADSVAQYVKLTQSIERIHNAWNPTSRDCAFQYNFYNLVDPKQVNLYGRPPNATNDAVWQKAVQENPDPSCLVPVIAIGFDDLRARIDAQTAQSASQLQKISDLQTRLNALRTQHSVSNASRLLRAASMQTQVIQRLMRFIQHLHLLIPSVRSSALRPEEEALRGKLEELEEEMRRGRVKGRLNELWALIGAVGASAEMNAGGAGNTNGDWAVVDEEGLAQIAQILSEQQAGLQHLTKILQKGQKDLSIITGNRSAKEGDDIPGEHLWGSTSTLRSSSLR